ncbi:hypothetical protein AB0K00_55620 [Dactylosporangium sp. NPDC049525]|uniref:hypothetical protein n=1 Tax=Dactylosporangium sp. NPDC049525 TaxID=3154730 RepID=UPI0034467FC2
MAIRLRPAMVVLASAGGNSVTVIATLVQPMRIRSGRLFTVQRDGHGQPQPSVGDPAHRPLSDPDAEIIDRAVAVQTLAARRSGW